MSDLNKRVDKIEKKLGAISLVSCSVPSGQVIHTDDEVDLRELWLVLWAGKWIVFVATFVFAMCSVFYSLSLPNKYRSEVLLASSEKGGGGGLASLAGQFGGLASLAGVNLGGDGDDKTSLAIEILKSRQFITGFIEKYDLLVPLMAAEGWDQSNDVLLLDTEIYDEDANSWVREPVPPRGIEPTPLEAYETFREILTVSRDKSTNYVTVGLEFYSPSLAQQWTALLVEEINEVIKQRDLKEAEKSIAFLKIQLNQTSVAEMQSIFFELIEEQSKTIMLTNVRDEYVFTTLDPAFYPELKAGPKRAVIVLLLSLAGGFFGVFIVVIKNFIK